MLFMILQYNVKQEIRQCFSQTVSDKKLTLITLTPEVESQLDWMDDKEFRYKGTMYDVVKMEIVDDTTTIYHCISDRQETTLFANLYEQVKNNMDTKNNQSNPLKNLLKLLSDIYIQPQLQRWTSILSMTTISFGHPYLYSSFVPLIPSPPPKSTCQA